MNDDLGPARGCIYGAVLGITLIAIVLVVLAGCQATLSPADQRFIEKRFDVMQALSHGTLQPPEIIWTYDRSFKFSGLADCDTWSITLNAWVAIHDRDFMAYTMVPHEYGHMLSCHYRGHMGIDPHDEWWKETQRRLGGDENHV